MNTEKTSLDLPTVDLPLLTQSHAKSSQRKPTAVNASSLLAAYRNAKSNMNLYKTLSEPIDRVISPYMRPGFGLQISSPPGCCVERLLLGLIKSVTEKGKDVAVLDCQNKLRRGDIVESLDGKVELANKIFYQSCHTSEDLQTYFRTLPEFLSQNKEIALLIFSSISFPLQLETKYSARQAAIHQIRESISRACKEHDLVAVITSNMSTQFINVDGSRGTFDQAGRSVMVPQIDLTSKTINSLVISKTSRSEGRAVFTPTTSQQKLQIEFRYSGMDIKDKNT